MSGPGLSAIFIASVSVMFFFAGCTRPAAVRTEKTSAAEAIESYMDEGFVSDDLFRVVIFASDSELSSKDSNLIQKSKTRALAYMRKYLTESGKNSFEKIQPDIIGIINSLGKTRVLPEKSNGDRIVLFEIRQTGLKKRIDGLTDRRY